MNRDEFEATLFRYGNGTGSLSAVLSALTVYTHEVKAAAWVEGRRAQVLWIPGQEEPTNPYEKEADHG